MNWEILAVLGIPLAGGAALAAAGHRRWAAELNVALSIATFAAAGALTARVVRTGAILAFEPRGAGPVLVSFGATVGLTRQVGIGSVVGSVALLPTSFAIWRGWAGVGFAAGIAVTYGMLARRMK